MGVGRIHYASAHRKVSNHGIREKVLAAVTAFVRALVPGDPPERRLVASHRTWGLVVVVVVIVGLIVAQRILGFPLLECACEQEEGTWRLVTQFPSSHTGLIDFCGMR